MEDEEDCGGLLLVKSRGGDVWELSKDGER